MDNYAPKKVFILENDEYIEITYEELCHREESDPSYEDKFFLPMHGMLLEVNKSDFDGFYKAHNRQIYLGVSASRRGDISYNAFDTDEFNGEDFLVDESEDIAEQATLNVMSDKLRFVMSTLTEEENELVQALFYRELSEREWSRITGIPQKTINYRKRRILAKLKKLLEI